MSISLVFVTHNRLSYTKLALARLLSKPQEEFSLTIWDNASEDRTAEYLMDEVKDPRIDEIVLSKENLGPAAAINYIWDKAKTELVGKVDNDCLVTPGWTHILTKMHKDMESLGALACWHYRLDDFDETSASKAGKIQTFGNYRVFRHPWVCGSGFLMKTKTYHKFGHLRDGKDTGLTYYFLKMAQKGLVNGWYYPFILQEHMDDPKSKYCLLTDDEAIRKMSQTTYILRTHKITSMQQRWQRRQAVLKNLNCDPWQAGYYSFWRTKLRRIISRFSKQLNASKIIRQHRQKSGIQNQNHLLSY